MYSGIDNPFSKNIYVHGATTDLNEKILLPNMIDLFTYIALDHCEGTNVSITNLQRNNMSWVQLQAQYRINRMPELNETIRVSTQFMGVERLYCNRDFAIVNDKNETLVAATSKWCLINFVKRRPIRPLPELYDIYDAVKRENRLYDGELKKIQETANYENSRDFETYYSEIDFNNHITSSCYFKWLVNSMPIEFMKKHTPKFIEAKFMAELLYGDNITAEYKFENQLKTSHRITNKGKTNFIAEVEWE
jgi:medium-chain acyl-[acyl-carrier-protein] hydrolase